MPPETADDPRWARIVARDKIADGCFWYSVATTGIYCRPSCPSRTANPRNVQLHETLAAAKATGFRPCKRCNPDGISIEEENAAIIAQACRLIEESEEEPLLNDLAKAVGRSSSYFLLQYVAGDYNCLHQDLYGEHVFPLQVAILLSEPDRDFEGGEFVLIEQRPRRQSGAAVIPLRQGDAVVFAVHHRPVRGARGWYRVNLRHGVSKIRSGSRHTLGIIFHDAK